MANVTQPVARSSWNLLAARALPRKYPRTEAQEREWLRVTGLQRARVAYAEECAKEIVANFTRKAEKFGIQEMISWAQQNEHLYKLCEAYQVQSILWDYVLKLVKTQVAAIAMEALGG